MLILSSFLLFGNTYCNGIPQTLRTSFLRKFEIDGTQFALFSSVTSFPNILLPFFGGVFIDKIGVRYDEFKISPAIVLLMLVILSG